jgi:hypothetical protein
MFENGVLRIIFGSKMEGVTRRWKKLHNEGFHNLRSSSDIIMVVKYRSLG